MHLPHLAFALALLCLPAAAAGPAPASRQEVKEEAPALIERGRRLLEEGKAEEAQALFDRGHELAPGAATRVWVLRGWIALGRALDTLQELDELELAPAEKSYLMGLAMFTKAKADIAAGSTNAFTQSEIIDAARFLAEATAADGERLGDAWLPLAEAAWLGQDLERAAGAATRALARRPEDPRAHQMRGQIALSAFVAAHPGAEPAPELAQDPHFELASESLTKAAALLEKSRRPEDQALRADVLVQLGGAHLWIDAGEAQESYAAAIAADPARVPFGRMIGSLGAEGFASTVERGARMFAKAHPSGHPSAALMSWWNGFALFGRAQFKEAESAFRAAVELQPGFTNSWYYIFRSASSQQAFERALDALRRGFEADPAGLAQALQGDQALNLSILDGLVQWCASPQNHGGRTLHEPAALVSEIAAHVAPEQSRFWNNMGLFLRDQAELLYRSRKPESQEQARELWERAYVAYGKALELEPEQPNYINDTAVMLHYYLQRDLEHARQMYLDAGRLAQEQLARSGLTPEDRQMLQTARTDAQNNLRKLERRLKEIAEGKAREREPGDQN